MRIWLAFFLVLVGCDSGSPRETAPVTPSPPASASAEIASDEAPPPPTPEPDDFSTILGWYETKFQPAENRGKNIARAVSLVATIRLAPGEEFSFNKTVGARTIENGFLDAPVILKGEMDKGLGGGVCQVSSTIHAAVLMSGLEVSGRTPHSRPSKYMPPGLDAMVGFPDDCKGDPFNKSCYAPDLRFRNSQTFPVRLVVTIKEPTKKWGLADLRVELQGRGEAPPRPVYVYGTIKNGDFERRVKRVEGKPEGYKKLAQKGANGMFVTSTLKVNGVATKTYKTTYPPTDEVWEVGSDFSESSPPPWEPSTPDAGVDAPAGG